MRIILGLLTYMLLNTATGCAQEQAPLRIGTSVWPGYEILYVARSLTLFSEDIRLIEYPASDDVKRALAHAHIDGAALTLDEAITVASRGRDLTIVLVCDVSTGGDALIGKPEVGSVNDLKNTSVGVSSATTGRLILDAALTHAGASFSTSDLALREIAPQQLQNFWQDQSVAAVVTREPELSRLTDQNGRVLYSSNDIRGRIVDVLVIRSERLSNNATSIRAMINGYLEARRRVLNSDPAAMKALNARLRLNEAQLINALDAMHLTGAAENERLLNDSSGRIRKTSDALRNLMHISGLLKPGNDAQLNITTDYLPES